MENGGILYVFPVFHSAWMAKKIRYPAADDLFRVSQTKTRRRAAAVNFARQLSTHRYFPDPPGIGSAAKGSRPGFTVGDFSKAPTRVDTCQPGESPRLGVAEAPPFRKGGFDAASQRLPCQRGGVPPQSISHGSFLRIVTSLTRPVSAVQPKAPGLWDSQWGISQKHQPVWTPASLGNPPASALPRHPPFTRGALDCAPRHLPTVGRYKIRLLQYNDTGKIRRIRACCKMKVLQQALFCVYCPVWVLSVGVFSCWVPK